MYDVTRPFQKQYNFLCNHDGWGITATIVNFVFMFASVCLLGDGLSSGRLIEWIIGAIVLCVTLYAVALPCLFIRNVRHTGYSDLYKAYLRMPKDKRKEFKSIMARAFKLAEKRRLNTGYDSFENKCKTLFKIYRLPSVAPVDHVVNKLNDALATAKHVEEALFELDTSCSIESTN